MGPSGIYAYILEPKSHEAEANGDGVIQLRPKESVARPYPDSSDTKSKDSSGFFINILGSEVRQLIAQGLIVRKYGVRGKPFKLERPPLQ